MKGKLKMNPKSFFGPFCKELFVFNLVLLDNKMTKVIFDKTLAYWDTFLCFINLFFDNF